MAEYTRCNINLRPRAGRSTAPVLAVALIFVLVASCDTAAPVLPDSDCTYDAEGRCWTYLGLSGKFITAIADTPWGVFVGTRRGFWGERTGVFRLAPAADRWEYVGLDSALVSTLLVVPDDTVRLLAGMRSAGAPDAAGAALYATDDAGGTWMPWDGGLSMQHVNMWAHQLEVDPGDPKRIFWAQNFAVLRSLDGGRNWEYVLGDPQGGGLAVTSLHVSELRDGRIWMFYVNPQERSFIYRSYDWGDNWEYTELQYGRWNRKLAYRSDTGRLWSAEPGSIRYSLDDGDTWFTSFNVNGIVTEIFFRNDVSIALAAQADPNDELPRMRMYRSNQWGTSWRELEVPPAARGANNAILAADGSLVIGTWNGVWRVTEPFTP